jgi:hypothetical protein
MAQQARPKVAGHSDDFRAQLMSESSRVVSTSGNASAMTFSRPINFLHCRLPIADCQFSCSPYLDPIGKSAIGNRQ